MTQQPTDLNGATHYVPPAEARRDPAASPRSDPGLGAQSARGSAVPGDHWPRPLEWLSVAGSVPANDEPAMDPTRGAVPSAGAPAAPKSPMAIPSSPSGHRRLTVLNSSAPLAGASTPPASRSASESASSGVLAFFRKKQKKRPGSGIPARTRIRALRWLRRISQTVFAGLFVFLLLQTTFRGSFEVDATDPVRLPYTVEAFLLADPFVALMTLLSTQKLYLGLKWSGAVIALTLVFGRVFCGWICPLGTLHHVVSWLFPSRDIRSKRRVEANKTRPAQAIKNYILFGSLGAALAGSAIGGLMDPICIAVRALGLGGLAVTQYLGVRLGTLAAETNLATLQHANDAAQDFLTSTVWTAKQAYYHQSWLVLWLFGAMVLMNRFIPRFWCRMLCPLGALLGFLSRFALFGMEKDHSKCTDCNLCLVDCQGADSPQGGVKHRQDECHGCLNCEVACPEDVIKFRFLPNLRSAQTAPDLDRRAVLGSVAAGAALIPSLRVGNWPDRAYNEKVIRPPGSLDERDFLDRCIRCAECMKVCPNNALHPAMFEAGIEGLWTPILIPRIGYCEFSCVLCGQVCPTGAIAKIDESQKMGIDQKPISLGTAMYDRGRCLPWAMETPCIVCEEFCPTSPKAIWVEHVEVAKRSSQKNPDGGPPVMETVKLGRPHVDPTLCIGCGACETVCPIVDKPAVYITSAGESRSTTNVILLENTSYNQKG